MAGLLAGVLLGAALQSWLRVDIVPIGVSINALQCAQLAKLRAAYDAPCSGSH